MPEQEQQMTAGPAAGAGGEGRRAHVPDGLILALACVAQFMVVLDVSIVNVALPSIGRELHYSATGLQWVVNAYVLTFAGFLLLGGRAADLFGRRRVYLFGMGLFTLASLAGGLAAPRRGRAARGRGGAGRGRRLPVPRDADDHRHDVLRRPPDPGPGHLERRCRSGRSGGGGPP